MKIVVSPAKTMIENTDCYIGSSVPTYIDKSKILLEEIRQRSYEELKEIWKCNEKIANENFDRFKNMNLQGSLTPAIFSYQGIQYQYMAVNVMEASAIEYIKENLYILSGFFGILRAFDGVSPYRLEMQAKMARGEMVNFIASGNIQNEEEIKKFDRLGFKFDKELSNEKKYVFILE